MNDRKILNDEQYLKSLEWLVEKAQLIEHPLLDDVQREKLLKQYDFVAERVREYRLNGPPAPKEEITDWLDD